MAELPSYKQVDQDIPLKKISHLRDSIFIVAYVSGLIEMIDFAAVPADPNVREPLDSFQVPCDDEQYDGRLYTIADMDVLHGSEEHILLVFLD